MANGGVDYRDGVLFCAQGDFDTPGGLVYMEAKSPYKATKLLDNFHGCLFNSPNDVVVHSNGSVWFTDPVYGYEQGFKLEPKLPSQVYCYAFTVSSISGSQSLTAKRVFAMADTGIPDDIKCDTTGNVYSGCGDSISVWSAGGVLIGKIRIPGGVVNFCFGRRGEFFLLNETKF
ncbi:hypothetical protein B0A49_07374 [Cryomyces minteri]|uniref:SMP-30/Gluconolactonase/LRE-like region domain-containing protein n=1 Tax=Cryomyces minteri TaxID=331657 RepID=A0A4U0X6B6_9PEZI|nr:hypothetical protein B0A49_07374 [Cryomyces minteri]